MWYQLSKIHELIGDAITIAESSVEWDMKFDLIFSPAISERIARLMSDVGLSLDYYDPDASSEDDVRAYIGALNGVRRNIQKILQSRR